VVEAFFTLASPVYFSGILNICFNRVNDTVSIPMDDVSLLYCTYSSKSLEISLLRQKDLETPQGRSLPPSSLAVWEGTFGESYMSRVNSINTDPRVR